MDSEIIGLLKLGEELRVLQVEEVSGAIRVECEKGWVTAVRDGKEPSSISHLSHLSTRLLTTYQDRLGTSVLFSEDSKLG